MEVLPQGGGGFSGGGRGSALGAHRGGGGQGQEGSGHDGVRGQHRGSMKEEDKRRPGAMRGQRGGGVGQGGAVVNGALSEVPEMMAEVEKFAGDGLP